MPDRDTIRTVEERSSERGWTFVCDLAGTGSVEVRLDWADYDHWCPDGRVPPERFAAAVLRSMLEYGAVIPPAFDAARVRHVVPDADVRVVALAMM